MSLATGSVPDSGAETVIKPRWIIAWLALIILAVFPIQKAAAIPVLQLYVEGGVYDPDEESWLVTVTGSTPIRLWAIGAVGDYGTIYDVKISAAYSQAAGTGVSFAFTPGTTGGLGGFTDPSTPSAPTHIQTVTDGSAPKLNDGKSLPSHGVFGLGTYWQEFALGNFTLKDSPTADFINTFPSPSPGKVGQISVFDVVASGSLTNPYIVHFDLYNHVMAKNHAKSKFAPFSHDGGGTSVGSSVVGIPEPSGLLFAALAGTVGMIRAIGRRRRRTAL